jgi:hypothetical protein
MVIRRQYGYPALARREPKRVPSATRTETETETETATVEDLEAAAPSDPGGLTLPR